MMDNKPQAQKHSGNLTQQHHRKQLTTGTGIPLDNTTTGNTHTGNRHKEIHIRKYNRLLINKRPQHRNYILMNSQLFVKGIPQPNTASEFSSNVKRIKLPP
eukprot:8098784-Ditylum_brightwellii.AAC.1